MTRRPLLVEGYLAQLEQELAALAREYPTQLATVYVGGGTPSLLTDREIARLVEAVRGSVGWGSLENTLEINPGTVTPARAAHWKSLGFDRASVGIQSLHDPTLKVLGRKHTAGQARRALEALAGESFRVSADLMTAVPGQPLEADVRAFAELGVAHVSAYTLTIEPATEFARRGVIVDEDDERAGFELTEELLGEFGFQRYEVSNYARAGQQSRHNLAYWQGSTYLGAGPSGAGHYPVAADTGALSMRRTNPALDEWLLGNRGDEELIFPHDYVTDALFMGLRLHDGVDIAGLSARSGVNVQKHYAPVIKRYIEHGLLFREGDFLRATRQGWWLLNAILRDFLQHDLQYFQ